MKHSRLQKILFVAVWLLVLPTGVFAMSAIVNPDGPAVAEISVISESRSATILELSFRHVDVDTVETPSGAWTRILLPGSDLTTEPGFPELPELSRWIHIPNTNCEIEILDQEFTTRNWSNILPAPQTVFRSALNFSRMPDIRFYSGRDRFPATLVRMDIKGGLGGVGLGLVTFNPVQVDPVANQVIIYYRIRVRITHSNGNSLDSQAGVPKSRQSLLGVLNIPDVDPLADHQEPRMIIVTEPIFDAVLDPFIEWKNRSGIPIHKIYYSEVASSAAGLKSHIADYCESAEFPPEFLFIVGDVNIIPAFFGVNSSLTDHPYSTLNDDDYLPDISVGRLPCNTAAECSHWVNRFLHYERDGIINGDFNGTVFSSSAAIDPQHGIAVSNLFSDAGMTVEPLQQPQTGTLPMLMNSLNNGPEWAFYIGHGYSQSWSSVAPPLQNSQLESVNATSAATIVSVACATADLDYPGLCLAEKWVTQLFEPGAIAYFGATESTAFFYSDTLGIATLRGIFESGLRHLGTAADYGRLMCAESFPQAPGGITEETIQQFILVGDPSMRVFAHAPQELDADFTSTLPLGAESFAVTVYMNDEPVEFADVCLRDQGSCVCALTSETGQAILPIGLTSPGILDLTITARDAIPLLSEIHIVPVNGPYLNVASWTIEDDAGDNDGQLDRGELAGIQLSMTNNGNASASAGVVEIFCSHAEIDLLTETIMHPPLGAGETIQLSEQVQLSASSEISDGDEAILTVQFSGLDSFETESVLPLPLHAPEIEFLGSTMIEDSGDGDGNPEGGEVLALELRFLNSGSDAAQPLTISLNSSPQYLHIQETAVTSPALASGTDYIARFTFTSEENTPRGYPFEFNYTLSGEDVPSQAGWGMERIGRIPVLLYELDEMPDQIDAIEAALQSLGVEYERSATLPMNLLRYMSVWIFCGVSPNQQPLSQMNATRLAGYLDEGGTCYWEGGDVWSFNLPTDLNPYFHIIGLSDGTSNAGPIEGEFGTAYADFAFDYDGENSFIDQLGPGSGSLVMLRNAHPNADYAVCIAFANEIYRTIGSSIEIGSLVDAAYPSTRVRLVRSFLDWFEIPSRVDIFPPVIEHIPLGTFHLQNAPIEIVADIQDATGVESAALDYRINNGAWQTISMVQSNGLYRASVPGGSFGTHINYRIQATDNSPVPNSITSDEYLLVIERSTIRPVELDFTHETYRLIKPRIEAPAGTSWSLTENKFGQPVVHLAKTSGNQPISYTTEFLDCSGLEHTVIEFWNLLRSDVKGESAKILGSDDGGRTFSYLIWQRDENRGIFEEGIVQSEPQSWMNGQNIKLRFEYSGNAYWDIGTVSIIGTKASVHQPVKALRIQPENRHIRLQWYPVENALGYAIMASDATAGNYAFLSETSDTTFADLSAEFFERRFYTVYAIMERGSSSIPAQINGVRIAEPTNRDSEWDRHLRAR